MSKGDCNILVEKLVSRISSFGTKKLSYSGRLVLVNSVLTALYNYWINIFVIPKGVLNKVNAICRNYLWDGSPNFIRVPRVSWAKVCVPKSEGGLGIKDSITWNHAAIGKLVWWVYCSPDRLLVKWVNQVYIKGRNWAEYTPSADLSWGWKSICKVQEKLAPDFHNGQWLLDTKGYTMASGYDLFRDKFQTVHWHKMVWNSWCILKHQFMGWFISREALMLKDKLYTLGIAADDLCLLCVAGTESHSHLFQSCPYSRKVLSLFDSLVGTVDPDESLLSWIAARKFLDLKTGVLLCAAMALYYHLWMHRNRARIEGILLRPGILRDVIMKEFMMPGIDYNDRLWLSNCNLFV
ncbi:uncharacterized protein LOC141628067 [Silene latifolia]|uniref:uncharacterized protein LOC141628067 n=1 Tax=Silene latifolia TaxID=37657 RepID=UPI003D788CBF